MSSLPDGARRFLGERRFATLATVDPDGSPHQAVVWYLLDGDGVVVNSAVGRHWPSNLCRDPRFSLAVEDGYRYVTIRGRAEVVDDRERAQDDIAAMARLNHDPAAADRMIRDQFRREERISFRLHPARIHAEIEES